MQYEQLCLIYCFLLICLNCVISEFDILQWMIICKLENTPLKDNLIVTKGSNPSQGGKKAVRWRGLPPLYFITYLLWMPASRKDKSCLLPVFFIGGGWGEFPPHHCKALWVWEKHPIKTTIYLSIYLLTYLVSIFTHFIPNRVFVIIDYSWYSQIIEIIVHCKWIGIN